MYNPGPRARRARPLRFPAFKLTAFVNPEKICLLILVESLVLSLSTVSTKTKVDFQDNETPALSSASLKAAVKSATASAHELKRAVKSARASATTCGYKYPLDFNTYLTVRRSRGRVGQVQAGSTVTLQQ
jgi:hypothetical protein